MRFDCGGDSHREPAGEEVLHARLNRDVDVTTSVLVLRRASYRSRTRDRHPLPDASRSSGTARTRPPRSGLNSSRVEDPAAAGLMIFEIERGHDTTSMSLSQYLSAMLVVRRDQRLRAGGDAHAKADRAGHVLGALGRRSSPASEGDGGGGPGGGDSCAKAGAATQRSVAAAAAVKVRERRGDLTFFILL